MAKTLERRRVIELRKQGKSYSEIKQIVPVSKSSLSLWLHNIPLDEEKIQRINGLKERAIERFRESMRMKREARLDEYYKTQYQNWNNFTERELLIAGMFLYWGEGGKAGRGTVTINNTDPAVVKFALYWILSGLKVAKDKIRVQLHLYSDMNIEMEMNYWSDQLKISRNQFNKPYIKESRKIDIDQKGFGRGTCCLIVGSTFIKENILMSIKAIGDIYGKKLT